jgi:replicative DNA helicase
LDLDFLIGALHRGQLCVITGPADGTSALLESIAHHIALDGFHASRFATGFKWDTKDIDALLVHADRRDLPGLKFLAQQQGVAVVASLPIQVRDSQVIDTLVELTWNDNSSLLGATLHVVRQRGGPSGRVVVEFDLLTRRFCNYRGAPGT